MTPLEMETYCRRMIMRYSILICFLTYIGISTGIKANISKSFPESIPYIASGSFIYDTLDFTTTPFLYGFQKTDALSIKFTRDVEVEGLFLTGRSSIFDFPIYWAVNLLANGNKKEADEGSQTDRNLLTENENRNYRFMLGYNFFDIVGIGVYILINRLKSETFEVLSVTTKKEVKYNEGVSTEDDLYLLQGDTYGVELGGNYSNIPFAWTLSGEYRSIGGSDSLKEPNNHFIRRAPSLIFDVSSLHPPHTQRFGSLLSSGLGNNRKEIRSNLLTWYTLIEKKLNVGLDANILIPFGEGKTFDIKLGSEPGSRILESDNAFIEEGDNNELPFPVKLSGFHYQLTPFIDYDFYLTSKKESVFRISPSITYRNISETLSYNSDFNFKGSYNYLAVNISFKFQLFLTESKNFILYIGWLPRLIFLQRYVITTKSKLETPDEFTTTNTRKIPKEDVSDYFFGFSYKPFEKLKFNISFNSFAEEGKINISQIDLGADYYF